VGGGWTEQSFESVPAAFMKTRSSNVSRRIIWGAAALLFVMHQDFWWWGDRTMVFGFLPVGLLYHAAFSVAAATLWACATRFAWPHHIEEWANAGDVEGESGVASAARSKEVS
jgi:hypothetical protein